MAEDSVIFNTNTWVAEVIYYLVSLLVLFVLLIGKVFVDTRNSRFLHIFYTLFVFGIVGIQFCLAIHGTSFLKGFFHINYDIDYSEPIRFGAVGFALLCYIAVPSGRYR